MSTRVAHCLPSHKIRCAAETFRAHRCNKHFSTSEHPPGAVSQALRPNRVSTWAIFRPDFAHIAPPLSPMLPPHSAESHLAAPPHMAKTHPECIHHAADSTVSAFRNAPIASFAPLRAMTFLQRELHSARKLKQPCDFPKVYRAHQKQTFAFTSPCASFFIRGSLLPSAAVPPFPDASAPPPAKKYEDCK